MAEMRIYVVDLESVPSRYTCEWKEYLPSMLRSEIAKAKKDIEVINISGGEECIEATPGAFLNFQQTNIYKNNQLNEIAKRFSTEVKPGDKFLFADAWNTGILQLKYMSELLNIPVEIHGLWHAGSYDPHDFLGRLIKDKNWTYNTERALYHAIDFNWFATGFHERLFDKNLFGGTKEHQMWRTGWPMGYMPDIAANMTRSPKENLIVFPHRVAPEKQPDIFRDLAKSMPQYEFVVCQDNKLTKAEYHKLLSRAKLMWSANLQETLGISPYEGALHGVVPLLPNRLSYTEMYGNRYLYPSQWTASYMDYEENKQSIMDAIDYIMVNYEKLNLEAEVSGNLATHLHDNYFTAKGLVYKLLS